MDYREALDVLVDHHHAAHFRRLCEDGSDVARRDAWRARVVAMATDKPTPKYPPLLEQAANLAGAVVRSAAALVRGDPVKVPPETYYERLEVCRDCEFNGERPFGVHCTKCGCFGKKLELAQEECPVGKWGRWERPES